MSLGRTSWDGKHFALLALIGWLTFAGIVPAWLAIVLGMASLVVVET